jgi:hypothetical protein
MIEQAEKLYQETKDLKKISPMLLMRKTGQSYESCVQLCNEISLMRWSAAREMMKEVDLAYAK